MNTDEHRSGSDPVWYGNLRPAPQPDPATMPKRESPWIPIVVGLVLGLGLTARAAYWLVGDSWQGFASLRWSQTSGVVVQTGLEQWTSSRTGNSYRLVVVYRYSVEGREYQNDRVSFPEKRASGDREYYQRQLNTKYPVGRTCTVCYNPDNPSESCLEPGTSLFFMIMIGLLTVGLLAGSLATIAYGIRELRHGPQPGP